MILSDKEKGLIKGLLAVQVNTMKRRTLLENNPIAGEQAKFDLDRIALLKRILHEAEE